jgi:hypothetical protein
VERAVRAESHEALAALPDILQPRNDIGVLLALLCACHELTEKLAHLPLSLSWVTRHRSVEIEDAALGAAIDAKAHRIGDGESPWPRTRSVEVGRRLRRHINHDRIRGPNEPVIRVREHVYAARQAALRAYSHKTLPQRVGNRRL